MAAALRGVGACRRHHPPPHAFWEFVLKKTVLVKGGDRVTVSTVYERENLLLQGWRVQEQAKPAPVAKK